MGSVVQRSISNEVLDKTMRLFWTKGYFNTSVDDVIAVTGFNRTAIYNYFGSKHDLFLAMLKRYRETVTPQLTAHLRHPENGLQAIIDFFNQFSSLNKTTMPSGCFLIATASDLPSHDKQVSAFIQDFSNELRALFLNCIIQAERSGASIDKKIIADFLMANIFGLMTLHRTQVSTSAIKHHIETVLLFLQTLANENNH